MCATKLGHLFEAIEGMPEVEYFVLLSRGSKSFGLLHVDLFIELAIQVGAMDVESSDVPILKCGKCKHEAHCFKVHNWREDLVKI